MYVSGGIEMPFREGHVCAECSRIERETWVREWQERYGTLGPIVPATHGANKSVALASEELVV